MANTLFRQLGLLIGKKLDPKISAFTVHTLSDTVADLLLFHSEKRISIKIGSLTNASDTCGWKPYPERIRCGFYNIRIRVDVV